MNFGRAAADATTLPFQVECKAGLGVARTYARNDAEEEEANARLVAAAPAMLEALVSIEILTRGKGLDGIHGLARAILAQVEASQ